MIDIEPNLDFDKQSKVVNINNYIKKMEQVKINKAEVLRLLESGTPKMEVKESLYPTLTNAVWLAALKQMGLSSFRVKTPAFIIEDFEPVAGDGVGYNPANQVSKEEETGLSI